MSEVEWRPIPSMPGYYASGDGDIWALRRGVLTQYTNAAGYKFVSIKREGRWTSRAVAPMVCEAFHGPPPYEDAEADHIDERRGHNRKGNLRWLPRAVNRRIRDVRAGERHPHRKLTQDAVDQVRAAPNPSAEDIKRFANAYGVSRGTIRAVLRGEAWSSRWAENRITLRRTIGEVN